MRPILILCLTGGSVLAVPLGAQSVYAGPPISAPTIDDAYKAAVLADSPVGYWRFNEDYGTATYADSSGNSYALTAVNGSMVPMIGAIVGSPDRAMFSALANGQRASLPAGLQTGWPSGQSFSIEAWVWPSVGSTWSPLFDIGTTASSSNNRISFNFGTNVAANPVTPTFIVHASDGSADSITCPKYIVGSSWMHMVGTTDGSTMKLYVNGSLCASGAVGITVSTGVNRNQGGVFTTPYADSPPSAGIDELALYNTALSAARVLAHFQAGVR